MQTIHSETSVPSQKWLWFWLVMCLLLIILHTIAVYTTGSTLDIAYALGSLVISLGVPLVAGFITFCCTRFKDPIWSLMVFAGIALLTLLPKLLGLLLGLLVLLG